MKISWRLFTNKKAGITYNLELINLQILNYCANVCFQSLAIFTSSVEKTYIAGDIIQAVSNTIFSACFNIHNNNNIYPLS